MKRLFDERYETYNKEGNELSEDIRYFVSKTFNHMSKELGYSINDIEKIFMDEVSLYASELKIMRNIKKRKNEIL